MGARHRARERALQCLYQWETTGATAERILPGFWSVQPESSEVREFTERLLRGTIDNVTRIDPLGRVDRSILRLGVYELLCEDDTPAAVVIDEAIELAKRFSGESAGQFVNGILDGIRQRLEGGETGQTTTDSGGGES